MPPKANDKRGTVQLAARPAREAGTQVAWIRPTGSRRLVGDRRSAFGSAPQHESGGDVAWLSPPRSRTSISLAMQLPDGSDAEQRYYRRVVEDCERALGPGIELQGLEQATDGDVVLRLTYGLGSVDWTSEGHGVTVVAAHAALREQLVVDRIRVEGSLTALPRCSSSLPFSRVRYTSAERRSEYARVKSPKASPPRPEALDAIAVRNSSRRIQVASSAPGQSGRAPTTSR